MSEPRNRLWDIDRLKLMGNDHRQHERRRTVRRSMTCQDPRATKRAMSMTRNSIDMIDLNTKWDVGRLSDPVWMALLQWKIFICSVLGYSVYARWYHCFTFSLL